MKSIIKNTAAVVAVVATLVACDSDINSLGTDFLGVDIDNLIQNEEFQVVTFSSALNPVQTNGFNSQPFGVYDDPVYGRSYHEFVTQLSIPSSNPTFGTNVAIDSVVLSIPLFSSVTSVEGSNRSYRLDSVYNSTATTTLKLYENNYFLNTFNPSDLTSTAEYFSDLGPTIDANKGTLIYDGLQFSPSSAEVRLIDSDVNGLKIPEDDDTFTVNSRQPPAFRAVLARAGDTNLPSLASNINYWKTKIIDQQGTSNLSSNGEFQNYFRGLYFQIDRSVSENNLTYFNLSTTSQASVIIYYKSLPNATSTDLVSSTYTIGLNGNGVNLINQEINPNIASSLASGGNQLAGDANIFLKGGPGAMAFIDLFGPDLDLDGEADQLTALRARNVVVNDATLTFFVDQSQVINGGTSEPERIIIYDVVNKLPLADFIISSNSNTTPVNSNTTHLGRLVRETPGDLTSKGVSYTLRLTSHMAQLLSGERENVRLGIAVSQNVELLGVRSSVKNNNSGNAITIDQILLSSAISHEGTVLHGSNSPDLTKRPVFKIFFTEAN